MRHDTRQRLLDAAGDIEIDLRKLDNFSGRDMVGETTNAIVFSKYADLLAVAAKAAIEAYDEGGYNGFQESHMLVEAMKAMRFDSDGLGPGLVAY